MLKVSVVHWWPKAQTSGPAGGCRDVTAVGWLWGWERHMLWRKGRSERLVFRGLPDTHWLSQHAIGRLKGSMNAHAAT